MIKLIVSMMDSYSLSMICRGGLDPPWDMVYSLSVMRGRRLAPEHINENLLDVQSTSYYH